MTLSLNGQPIKYIYCSSCGEALETIYTHSAYGDLQLEIKPCQECIQKEIDRYRFTTNHCADCLDKEGQIVYSPKLKKSLCIPCYAKAHGYKPLPITDL
jgi:hypothetical protein